MAFGKSLFKGKTKGFGKGKASQEITRLASIDDKKKCWVGNLQGVPWKALQEHFSQAGKVTWAQVFEKSGTATVVYSTPQEAQMAIEVLNGSILGESQIQVDSFVKPAGRKVVSKGGGKFGTKGWSSGKAGGKAFGKAPVIQTQFQKTLIPQALLGFKGGKGGKLGGKLGGKGGKGKEQTSADIAKLKTIDNSLKVWVGGLTPAVTWKELQNHFNQIGKTIYAAVFKGTGCVAFKTPDEASVAIASLNGSELGGGVIQVDTFQKNS